MIIAIIMMKNRIYHLAELLNKPVKSVVSKTQGGLYMYTMQLPCICTYVWLAVTEILMVSVTNRNVPKFGTLRRKHSENDCIDSCFNKYTVFTGSNNYVVFM